MAGPILAGKVTLDDSHAEAALRRIGMQAGAAAAKVQGSLGGALKSLAGPIAALGPAIAGAFSTQAIAKGVVNVFEAGRALQVLSRQTGASVGGLAVLQAKFKGAGLDADGVGNAIFRLQKSLNGVEDDENKGGAGRLEKLGLNLAQIKKLAPDQQLMAVGRAISAIANPAERTAASMQIFGKSGAQLNAVFGPGFSQVSPALAQKAALLARNAAVFEQVSIKLERVGNVLKTFYVGVADRVGTTLLPILSQIERINLVGVGQKFGDGLSKGALALAGAFQLPEPALTAVQTGLAYAFAQSGNVLLGALKTGTDFFKDGMMASLQGIGSVITATFMRSFAAPLAYLQAGIEFALQRLPKSMGGGDFRDADEEDKLWKKVQRLHQLRDGTGPAATFMETENDRNHFDGTYDQSISDTEKRLAQVRTLPVKQSFEDIYNERKGQAGRFGLMDGGQTADEWEATGRAKSREGMAAAWNAARNSKVEDKLGAADYGKQAAAAVEKLTQAGQRLIGGGGPAETPKSGLSMLQQVALLAQSHMALASSHAPAGADPAAYMFMGDGGPHNTAWGRTNASDPYTARVDAARRSDMYNSHTVGIGGALDGRDTSLHTGGLGGAYGATDNIWRQISGYGKGGRKTDPQEKISQHLDRIAGNQEDLLNVWQASGGGGKKSGGKGGGTPTGK